MKDTRALRFRPRIQGIPAQPLGGIPMDQGIPMNAGVPAGPQHIDGIPMGYTDFKTEPTGPAKCTATTKKGDPCKAFASGDGLLCVGHGRQ